MSNPINAWDIPEKKAENHKEALRRSPVYRQEWEAAFQSYCLGRVLQSYYLGRVPGKATLPPNLKSRPLDDLRNSFVTESPQAKELCRRFGLTPGMALHPDNEFWGVARNSAQAFFKDSGEAIKVIPYGKAKLRDISENESELDVTPLQFYHLKDGRYLHLDIDLFQSQSQIEVEVKERVKIYQEVINKKAVKGASLDIYLYEQPDKGPVTIFEVWDMKKEGKSPWVIAKGLYSCLQGTTYHERSNSFNYKAKSLRKQICDAITRAAKEIASIKPTP
jgi:hypothetical protein